MITPVECRLSTHRVCALPGALYLSDGAEQALLISYDLLVMERELLTRLKGAICAVLPLEPETILFTCTHTHEGPEVRERKFRDRWYDEERPTSLDGYLSFLTERSVEVAKAVVTAQQPCDLLLNRAHVAETMNRRFFLEDGRYHVYSITKISSRSPTATPTRNWG